MAIIKVFFEEVFSGRREPVVGSRKASSRFIWVLGSGCV